ncbi:hypothetical protein KIN20_019702 [Parelaphostrongylus tenuis]|uniref:Uncharacterized protein n=1 Tax=Parelaphostrongylus tenuis TaxID=148309 RepID=A0AAD5N909_PARTN|nr:hypothetical protein KIN20_019702 [Parelaphostrongylus tenuis]
MCTLSRSPRTPFSLLAQNSSATYYVNCKDCENGTLTKTRSQAACEEAFYLSERLTTPTALFTGLVQRSFRHTAQLSDMELPNYDLAN